MALPGFNQLVNSISSAASNTATTVSTLNNFTAGLGNNNIRSIGNISDRGGRGSNLVSAAASFLSGGRVNGNVGSALRMFGNATQGVGFNAAPPDAKVKQAVLSQNNANLTEGDWRVGISVPQISDFSESQVFKPFADTGGRMIFPFNPTILLGHSASYQQIQPTHTNFPMNAYQNSQVDNITITGEYYNENQQDALYWIATLHFLRTITKMFYGDSNPQGNPPPVCRLTGYGPHVLNNIPIVVQNFTTDLPADVDYIECDVGGKINHVPVQSQFTVTVMPTYSRRTAAKFNLNTYAKGTYNVEGIEGFV
jgi:hypothetical protein